MSIRTGAAAWRGSAAHTAADAVGLNAALRVMCAAFARKGEFVMEVTDGFKQASITAKSYSCAALCKNWVKIQKGGC